MNNKAANIRCGKRRKQNINSFIPENKTQANAISAR